MMKTRNMTLTSEQKRKLFRFTLGLLGAGIEKAFGFKHGVSIYTADQIKNWDCQSETVHGWKLARPYGMDGLGRRFKMAWLVFSGKADVLKWHDQ